MRNSSSGTTLKLRAIGGLHVVTLAWDFLPAQEAAHTDLLGFAIERSEFKNGQEVERFFLRGLKRFKGKDAGLAPGTLVPTSEHPVQSFQWGDYTVQPGTTYRYRVVPAYGKPKLLQLNDAAAVAVEITTESEVERDTGSGVPRHSIYFNRGAAGSQAYARRFEDPTPDENDPESDQMKWLSRGLYEGLRDFIEHATGPDAGDYGLRGMFYEFRYLPVAKLLSKARKAGADVALRYEAQTYKKHNVATIQQAKIASIAKPQKSRAGIRHNKFIVLLHKGSPKAVWTGSTNISAGGIFGHSNVGHVVWDDEVATRFMDYWTALADPDVTRGDLVAANRAVQATPQAGQLPPAGSIWTLFSPRDDQVKDESPTMDWYAQLFAGAKRVACMTFAFNLDAVFENALARKDATLRFAVFDKTIGRPLEEQFRISRNALIAVGDKFDAGELENFKPEALTGFNRNLYIHDKFLLVDPLGTDPIVVTGTANFSHASQKNNDENMLVIRSNTRVADIYFGEFMRIFDHLYSRYVVRMIKEEGGSSKGGGFLKERTIEWLTGHLKPGSRKDLRRRYFVDG